MILKYIVLVLNFKKSSQYFYGLMVAVFGEKGKHARSAVGMAALPMNMAVEIEMIVEVDD